MQLYPHEIFKSNEILNLVTRYNRWFINLRYFAVALLMGYLISLKVIPGVVLSDFQFYTILTVMFLIFSYNILFEHLIKNLTEENNHKTLNYAFLQILQDIVALSIVVYVSGGLEAPIFMFFVFHMIIGSILLPGIIIYSIGASIIVIFSVFSFLEYQGVIPHHKIEGLFSLSLYDDLTFLIGSMFIFGVMIISSILLTRRIAAELYNREKELRTAMEELAEAEINKQKYTMAVVHELKSPIAAAHSFLDLVLGGYSGKIDEDASQLIGKSKNRITESIDNINNILRLSKFKVLNQVNHEELNLSELIARIAANYESIARRKEIDLNLDLDSFSASEFAGDPVLLQLAFSNLIGNAVKYTPDGGTVNIILKKEDKISIKIIDDGIGIPEEDQKRIFEEYYRASNAKNSNIEGTGTGLAVVKNIFEAHKGSVFIKSPSILKKNSRPGTEFKIILPVKS
ncbi:MAG: hypothetical protein SCALA702_28590 [Melioribacteraceae bacterium]|nr:MAG: hypothetical protein SCALA702_28590 [Melioribacteraceae bacterium]